MSRDCTLRARYEREKSVAIAEMEAKARRLEAEAEELWGRIAVLESETFEDAWGESRIDQERDAL